METNQIIIRLPREINLSKTLEKGFHIEDYMKKYIKKQDELTNEDCSDWLLTFRGGKISEWTRDAHTVEDFKKSQSKTQ